MGKETEKEVCVIITKSNQVKEIVFVDEDQATGYIEDRYREFIKTVPNYNFRESYLSPDRTFADPCVCDCGKPGDEACF